MDAVDPHVDHHEEVVALGIQEALGHVEVLVGETIDVPKDSVLVVRTKIRHVDEEFLPQPRRDLITQLGWMGVLAPRARRQKAAHHLPVNRADREGLRDPNGGNAATILADPIPDAWVGDCRSICDRHAVIRVVGSVAEAVEPQLTGVAPGQHRRPRGNRDRRDGAVHPGPHAFVHQAIQRGQVVAPGIEDEFGCRAIETHHDHATPIRGHRGRIVRAIGRRIGHQLPPVCLAPIAISGSRVANAVRLDVRVRAGGRFGGGPSPPNPSIMLGRHPGAAANDVRVA